MHIRIKNKNQTLNDGHVPELTNEEYHAAEGLSSTGIRKIINGTPAHYKAYLDRKEESTSAMKLGTVIHKAILEPQLFEKEFICKPEGMNFATIDSKAWKQASERSGMQIVAFDDFHMIREIQKNFRTDPKLRQLFSGGAVEQSYFWKDEASGVFCKCRPDYFDGTRVIDIKTAESASPKAFQHSIGKYGYHHQSAFYLDGLSQLTEKRLTDFIHVVIEKEAPYSVAIYVLDDASLDRARDDLRDAISTVAHCQKTDVWPGYSSEVQTMNLPHYMWEQE